jgi:membrane protein implicated in regulation of membrane protease activity
VLLAASIVGLFLLPSPWNVIGVVVAAIVEIGEVWLWIWFLRRYRVRGGAEGMIGERGEVLERCDPRGRVRLRGEIWHAISDTGDALEPGERVRVTALEGLAVRVARQG